MLTHTKVINMASPKALASILEGFDKTNPVSIPTIALTEDDSNVMIDKLASAIKFKAPDGDVNNSFDEGSDDEEIKLDDNGNYVGKGKMTIFNKDVDLKDPSKTTEQWMETPTGKVSDAETEEVPVNQKGVTNINEAVDLTPVGEGPSEEELKAHGMKASDLKAPNIEDHRNMKSPLNHSAQPTKVNGAIKNLFVNVPTKGGLHENFLPITEAVHANDPRLNKNDMFTGENRSELARAISSARQSRDLGRMLANQSGFDSDIENRYANGHDNFARKISATGNSSREPVPQRPKPRMISSFKQ